jgi:hypothetical protein
MILEHVYRIARLLAKIPYLPHSGNVFDDSTPGYRDPSRMAKKKILLNSPSIHVKYSRRSDVAFV